MKYLVYVFLFLITLRIAKNIIQFMIHSKLPESYFKYDNYQIDKNYNKNKKIKYSMFLVIFPDSIYPENRLGRFKMVSRIRFCIYLIAVVLLGSFTKFHFLEIITFLFSVEIIFVVYPTKYLQAKQTNYYTGVVYRALLGRDLLLTTKGIANYAVLPLGYNNLYFNDIKIKNSISKIQLDRKKNVALFYSGTKVRGKYRYFNLDNIYNTDFLEQFIEDLTFVENKVELKRLFNDIYFSDKTTLILADYILEVE